MREFLLEHRREIVNVLMTLVAASVALVLAAVAPQLGRRLFHRFLRFCARLARKPSLSVFFVSSFALAVFGLTIWVCGNPKPKIHDEFSYLLAGETYAHGRLSNPPIPDEL